MSFVGNLYGSVRSGIGTVAEVRRMSGSRKSVYSGSKLAFMSVAVKDPSRQSALENKLCSASTLLGDVKDRTGGRIGGGLPVRGGTNFVQVSGAGFDGSSVVEETCLMGNSSGIMKGVENECSVEGKKQCVVEAKGGGHPLRLRKGENSKELAAFIAELMRARNITNSYLKRFSESMKGSDLAMGRAKPADSKQVTIDAGVRRE